MMLNSNSIPCSTSQHFIFLTSGVNFRLSDLFQYIKMIKPLVSFWLSAIIQTSPKSYQFVAYIYCAAMAVSHAL